MAEADMLARVSAQLDAPEPAAPVQQQPAAKPEPIPQSAGEDDDYSGLLDELDVEQPEPEAPAPDTIELEFGGEVHKLTKTELKELAEAGRTYKETAKTLQEQRQAVEQERRIAQQISQVAPHVESLRAEGRLLLQVMQGLNQEVQSLKDSDPIAAFQKREQLNELQGRFNQLAQQEANVSGQLNHLQMQAMQQQLAAEVPVLLSKLPTWKDPAKRESDTKFIREYMQAEGYTPQHIAMATDARYIVTLLKAAKYDALRAKQASKKVNSAPQMATPGAAANPGLNTVVGKTNYRKALKAAGSDDSARAKIIQKRVESML